MGDALTGFSSVGRAFDCSGFCGISKCHRFDSDKPDFNYAWTYLKLLYQIKKQF